MKTQVVYVLVSNKNDIYCEQAILSLKSLYIYNPEVKSILVTDENTYDTLTGNRERILNIISETKIVKVPQNLSMLQRSRFLKTSLRNIIQGDYLFIDTDTIICDSLEEIDNFKYDIGAVKDHHLSISELSKAEKETIYKRADITSWEITENDLIYYNSGVMYVKDNDKTYALYEKWHRYWLENTKHNLNFDQPPLGKANSTSNNLIKELSGEWNCQLATNGISFLHEAKIIHYYYKTYWYKVNKDIYPYKFFSKSPFLELKEYENIPEKFIIMIKNAKSLFEMNTNLTAGEDVFLYSSTIFHLLEYLYYKHKYTFNVLNGSLKFFKKLIQK